MRIAETMSKYYPEISWSCNANDYDQLVIHSEHDKPTKKELESKWEEMTDENGVIIRPPSPDEAYTQIETLLVDAYTTAGAEKPYIDAMRLIDKYPSVERQVERGNYGVAIDYIEDEIMEKEEIVTAEMVDEIKAILNPKEDKS